MTKKELRKITFIKVESSTVDSIAWHKPKKGKTSLIVKFFSGTYIYFQVGEVLIERLMQAESKGKFLNAEIKGKFNFQKLE